MDPTGLDPSVILGAFGLNIFTLITGVAIIATKLAKIEAGQGVSNRDNAKLEARIDKLETDVNRIGELCRDVKTTVDTMLEIRKKPAA